VALLYYFAAQSLTGVYLGRGGEGHRPPLGLLLDFTWLIFNVVGMIT